MNRKRMISLLLALTLAVSLLTITAAAQGKFLDVSEGTWYSEAVDWAVEKAIASGTSETTFSPNLPCTRAQIVTFLWRAMGSRMPQGSRSPFSDVAEDAYYYHPVLWAKERGITSGTSATTFSPDATVTRAEAVTFLWRANNAPVMFRNNPFRDVSDSAYYSNAVRWAVEQGVTQGTSATTFSPDDPCTRAEIVTFLWRLQGAYPGSAFTDLSTNYPVILVHGLLGWGHYDDINAFLPYWGMTACRVVDHLREFNANVYDASVGPVSSAWDRACELYAQLSGTVTDYGAAHSKLHGHDRFGRDYTGGQFERLIPGPWDAQHPVNLVGHSFGGATSRTLLDLLSDGSADEQAYMRAHPEEGTISPLFTGGKADWIYSITALAAPSNGTTFIEANQLFTDGFEALSRDLAKALGLTAFKGIYDFQLEHFGIQPVPGEDFTEALSRVLRSSFADHHDSAYQDLTIDRAMFINQDIQMQPGVYYFSYYGNRSEYNPQTRIYEPNKYMEPLARPFSYNMGKYINYTKGSFVRGYGSESYTVTMPRTYCDVSWQPNDGLVNVVSGRWPYHLDHGRVVNDAHIQVNTPVVNATQRGVWYVMPERPYDHLTFMGGIFNENGNVVNTFYHDVFYNIIMCGG